MASPAAAGGVPAVPLSIRDYFRIKGDRLEVKLPKFPNAPTMAITLIMCFGASLMILFTENYRLALQVIAISTCVLLIPGLKCWRNSYEKTWLVVGPHKWLAVSGWMWSTPDPDRIVNGASITHLKEGLVKDFISVTVAEHESLEVLLFQSNTTRFQLEPYKLRMLSRADKEWLAGQINNFINEMKGRSHVIDVTNELQPTIVQQQQASIYSTLPESLRPLDTVGGFKMRIKRSGNRLDMVTSRPVATYSRTWISAIIMLSISGGVLEATVTTDTPVDIWVYVLSAFVILYGLGILCSIPKASEGKWLVVEQDTWQLITFSWLINDIGTMAFPQNGTSITARGSTQELCRAFVDDIHHDDSEMPYIDYCFSLRVQNSFAAYPKVIHIHSTTINEAQWLADEVNKHIRIVKEQPFPTTPLRPTVPMDQVIIRPVTDDDDEDTRTSAVDTQAQSSAASLAVIAREPSGPPQSSSLVDK
ncbi:hypothetical protein VaNZ11_002272 [Volvox africanus]|uniref:Uncharacterized protein n=1 Tax=Volvox africanus TaxID=51714 RepID=A0ABQ5RT56_9CHLO|nr:hypothetical protein VaNZ11_002272 [Volvox africanus]